MRINLIKLIVVLLGFTSNNVFAALSVGTTLSFDEGGFQCVNGGIYPNCTDGVSTTSGSWWAFDIQNDGGFDVTERILMSQGTDGGIVIGELQAENEIDSPWFFGGAPGNHVSTLPVTVVDEDSTTKLLDFSGWTISWNNILVPIGDVFEVETAELTCSSFNCADGDTFILDFYSTVLDDSVAGFVGASYAMHLEGVIVSAVPVPAALWLLVSGMGVLFVSAKRRCRK